MLLNKSGSLILQKSLVSEKGHFKNIRTDDITENFKPSLNRLRRLAIIPYYLLVKPFNLQNFININFTIAVEFHKLAEKGFIRYKVFTARNEIITL